MTLRLLAWPIYTSKSDSSRTGTATIALSLLFLRSLAVHPRKIGVGCLAFIDGKRRAGHQSRSRAEHMLFFSSLANGTVSKRTADELPFIETYIY